MELEKRHFIKSSEERRIRKKLSDSFGDEAAGFLLPESSDLEIAELDEQDVILIDGDISLFSTEKGFMPLTNRLKKLDKDVRINAERKVVVDEGAVEFILDGADIMSPGIVDADKSIEEGEIVFVIDKDYAEPLAIGIALVSGEKMVKSNKGKAIKSIHYAGDELWKESR